MSVRALLPLFSALFLLVVASAQAFEYEDLVALIRTKRLTAIERVLPELPEAFRSNYTLMHESLSLQDATPLAPRAILFGEDARLICTFNGERSQAGSDTIECSQFRRDERAFDYRQIRFPTADNGLRQVVFSERDRTADGKHRCSACHGADPRPNWAAYSIWPGAYGEADDGLRGPSAHREDYAKFVARRGRHPRYRWLIQSDQADAPYVGDFQIINRPNLRLSDFIGQWDALRAARLLETKIPYWRRLAFAIRALRGECVPTRFELARIKRAGGDFERDSDLEAIFKETGIPAAQWGTSVLSRFGEEDTYEHQFGFGYLTIGMASAIVGGAAARGDEALQAGQRKILDSYGDYSDGDNLAFRQRLATITPFYDYYQRLPEQAAAICRPLTAAYVREFLRSAGGPSTGAWPRSGLRNVGR